VKNHRIHIAKGYAIVSPGGKIQVDTVGSTKAHCQQYFCVHDEAKGNRIMRISIVVEIKP